MEGVFLICDQQWSSWDKCRDLLFVIYINCLDKNADGLMSTFAVDTKNGGVVNSVMKVIKSCSGI